MVDDKLKKMELVLVALGIVVAVLFGYLQWTVAEKQNTVAQQQEKVGAKQLEAAVLSAEAAQVQNRIGRQQAMLESLSFVSAAAKELSGDVLEKAKGDNYSYDQWIRTPASPKLNSSDTTMRTTILELLSAKTARTVSTEATADVAATPPNREDRLFRIDEVALESVVTVAKGIESTQTEEKPSNPATPSGVEDESLATAKKNSGSVPDYLAPLLQSEDPTVAMGAMVAISEIEPDYLQSGGDGRLNQLQMWNLLVPRRIGKSSSEESFLSKLNISNSDFSYSVFPNVKIREAKFDTCDFSMLNLSEGAVFKDCTFLNCNFSGASLVGVTLESCKVEGLLDLSGSIISGFNISQLEHKNELIINLSNSKSRYSFGDSDTSAIALDDAVTAYRTDKGSLTSHELLAGQANFSGVDFSRADLTNAHLVFAQFSTDVKMFGSLDDKSSLYNYTNASHAKLHLATFNCNGSPYVSTDAKAESSTKFRYRGFVPREGVDFSNAGLRGANFKARNFSYACFRDADLRGADFSEAILIGCDFTHAKLADANFTGASIDFSIFDESIVGVSGVETLASFGSGIEIAIFQKSPDDKTPVIDTEFGQNLRPGETPTILIATNYSVEPNSWVIWRALKLGSNEPKADTKWTAEKNNDDFYHRLWGKESRKDVDELMKAPTGTQPGHFELNPDFRPANP